VRRGGAPAKVGRSPVIERRRVLRPRSAVVELFERISLVDGSKFGIERLVVARLPHVAFEASIDRAALGVVLLRCSQRNRVGSFGEIRPAQLGKIILPKADQANVLGARLL